MAQKASANVVGLPAMVSKWEVSYMLRFRRSYVRHETPCHVAYIAFYPATGAVKEVSNGMVDVLHSQWRNIWKSCDALRAKMQRRRFAMEVAKVLIATPPVPMGRLIQRSQSVPRIYAGRRRRTRRSRSLVLEGERLF